MCGKCTRNVQDFIFKPGFLFVLYMEQDGHIFCFLNHLIFTKFPLYEKVHNGFGMFKRFKEINQGWCWSGNLGKLRISKMVSLFRKSLGMSGKTQVSEGIFRKPKLKFKKFWMTVVTETISDKFINIHFLELTLLISLV